MYLGINYGNFIFIFDIVEDAPGFGISLGEFRFAAQRNGGNDFAGLRVNYRRRLAASIEHVSFPLPRLVQHAVGVLSGVHLGKCLQRFQVNDGRLVFPSTTDKAAPEFRRGRQAMHARRVGDDAGDLILGEVNHDHFCPVRNVEALPRRIHGAIIPTAFAADGNFFDKMIGPVGAANRDGKAEQNRQ